MFSLLFVLYCILYTVGHVWLFWVFDVQATVVE